MPYKAVNHGKTVWRGQARRNGKKITRQFPTKREAMEWEARMRLGAEPQEQAPAPAPAKAKPRLVESKQTTNPLNSCPTALDWLTEYLLFAERYVAKTLDEKRSASKRFLKSLDNPRMPVDEITPGIVLRHMTQQLKARSAYMANKSRKNLSAAWTWGRKYMEHFPREKVNPFQLVDKFPHDEGQHYVPPEADFWRVVEVAEGQDRRLLLTLLYTAARKGKVFRWRWDDDIGLDNMLVRLGSKKNRSSTMEYVTLPMVPDLRSVLVEQMSWLDSIDCFSVGGPVFIQTGKRSLGRAITDNRGFPQELCRLAGVKPFGCHGIRGLTATTLARRGIPVTAVQAILRHAKLTTTDKYVRKMVGADVGQYLELLQAPQKPSDLSRAYQTDKGQEWSPSLYQ